MEFLNDRYASLDVSWDMNGKIFNRIPLLKRLKWRELIGLKILYGSLSDKNNPQKNPGDAALFLFPTRNGETTSFVMDAKKPYMECSISIHNTMGSAPNMKMPPRRQIGRASCRERV